MPETMVAYLKAGPQVRTYSNYLRVVQEMEKEDSMELFQSPRTQVTDYAQSHELPVSFLCGNSRATSPSQKHQPCVWHTWRKKAPDETRTKRVMIPMELMG